MKLRNCRGVREVCVHLSQLTRLQKRILLLILELVGPEKLETSFRLLTTETILVALEKLENFVDLYSFQIHLFLVVQVFSL